MYTKYFVSKTYTVPLTPMFKSFRSVNRFDAVRSLNGVMVRAKLVCLHTHVELSGFLTSWSYHPVDS